MKRIWASGLSLALGTFATAAGAEELQLAPTTGQAVVALTSEFAVLRSPNITLGKPVARRVASSAVSDSQVNQAGFQSPAQLQAPTIVRAKASDAPPPIWPTKAEELPLPKKLPSDGFAAELNPPQGGTILSGPISSSPSPYFPACSVCAEEDGSCDSGHASGGRFYGSAEYLLWTLKESNLPVLVTTGPTGTTGAPLNGILGQPGTQVLFGGSALKEDARSGARIMLGYWFDACQTWAIEGGGFFLEDKTSRFDANSDRFPLLSRPFFDVSQGTEFAEVTTAPGRSTGSISVETSSQFWGAEINLRRQVCNSCWYRLDLLAGGRYLDLNESLTITERAMIADNQPSLGGNLAVISDRFATQNRFYGGQFGGNLDLKRGRWSLGVRGMVGIGVTDESVDIRGSQSFTPNSALNTNRGGLLALDTNLGHFSRSKFSVVPEVGLTLGYQVTDHLRVFAGYNFLYWSDVLRPADQIDRNVNSTHIPNFFSPPVARTGPARPAVLLRETSFWAQGFTGGLEFRY